MDKHRQDFRHTPKPPAAKSQITGFHGFLRGFGWQNNIYARHDSGIINALNNPTPRIILSFAGQKMTRHEQNHEKRTSKRDRDWQRGADGTSASRLRVELSPAVRSGAGWHPDSGR
jgi:hypothetical protein